MRGLPEVTSSSPKLLWQAPIRPIWARKVSSARAGSSNAHSRDKRSYLVAVDGESHRSRVWPSSRCDSCVTLMRKLPKPGGVDGSSSGRAPCCPRPRLPGPHARDTLPLSDESESGSSGRGGFRARREGGGLGWLVRTGQSLSCRTGLGRGRVGGVDPLINRTCSPQSCPFSVGQASNSQPLHTGCAANQGIPRWLDVTIDEPGRYRFQWPDIEDSTLRIPTCQFPVLLFARD